ncbi:hypothetical protein HMPREF9455_03673 [Dysgonomonas gadei ATCC BAA-286]|uniref:Uncharacterized protein n=1 Tax=Dysgonomonas gadei ATCC BAA-286 TaxID=742766 RepID=F5J2V6_9BACT|nr:hypothetical protein HMPREF9455_03673 [Dysgonomonas gadei ATCC BAA-286]
MIIKSGGLQVDKIPPAREDVPSVYLSNITRLKSAIKINISLLLVLIIKLYKLEEKPFVFPYLFSTDSS